MLNSIEDCLVFSICSTNRTVIIFFEIDPNNKAQDSYGNEVRAISVSSFCRLEEITMEFKVFKVYRH